MFETKTRSIVKSFSWRVIATLMTLIIVYIYIETFSMSLKITLVGAVVSMIAFYIHERFWNRIQWGKTNRKNHS